MPEPAPTLGGDDIVLVTGAAGFIGSNVARRLAARGIRVVASDRLGSDERWRNLADTPLHDLITPEATPDFLRAEGDRVPVIVHMGAVSATTERDVDRIVRDNVRASLDLWRWCMATGARFLYASSAATYGDGSRGFRDDEAPDALAALRPLNAYGWSKHLVDRRIVDDARRSDRLPQWAGLKFFNVYGPGEDHKRDMRSVVNKIWPSVARGETVQLFRSHRPDFPDGGQCRDFVHVDDCVAVIEWLLREPTQSGLFNVGSGKARSFLDLALATFAAAGRPPAIAYIDMPPELRSQYQYFTEADMTKLRQRGYEAPATTLEDGVRAYVEGWLAHLP
jgi:ADP-L-glycero-D-manno-heptose 6-epimerase